eukprot:1191794-Prorocentrum_minimum.AAC.2
MYSPRAHKNVLGQSATSVTVYRTCPRVRVGMPYAMDNALPRPLIPPPGRWKRSYCSAHSGA